MARDYMILEKFAIGKSANLYVGDSPIEKFAFGWMILEKDRLKRLTEPLNSYLIFT